jgi:hypothetical protein|tara:strand:+ start:199 stop:375 length:177 start_codon:yes stop_codon:yes gene_type:complete
MRRRGLSSVVINDARSLSDEKKAKTIVQGNKLGKMTGSRDDMHEKPFFLQSLLLGGIV